MRAFSRSGIGSASTHCRTGTLRLTWSTRLAAVCAIRRAPHEGPRYLGHNPLGGWLILALLAAALLAGASGALYVSDRFWGDDAVYRWHRIGGWAFALLAPLHLAGVAFTSWRQRENLVEAMITGAKRAPGPGDVA